MMFHNSKKIRNYRERNVLCKKGEGTWNSLSTLALNQRKIHLESTREQPVTRRKWRAEKAAEVAKSKTKGAESGN